MYVEGLIVAVMQNTLWGYILYGYKIYPHRVFVKRHFLIPASSSLTKTDPYDLHLHDSVAGSGEEAE